MHLKIKKKLLTAIVFLFLVNLVFFGLLLSVSIHKTGSDSANAGSDFAAYADQIISRCSKSSHRPSCYDKEIPKLMDLISMEDAFAVTKIVQEKDQSYAYCHVLGHELSAREVKKNPDGWMNIIPRCPSGVCSNGCLHGGMQERFRAESLTESQIEEILPDLTMICEDKSGWSPTGLEQGSCYHALGHLTMYLSGAELDYSLNLCDRLAKKSDGRDFSHLCYDGAFMQIYQPLEPEDFALIKGKEVAKNTVNAFCDRFIGQKNASCWIESWPLFSSEIRTADGLITHCSHVEQSLQERCYDSLFYVLPVQLEFDMSAMTKFCDSLPENLQGTCFANTAGRLIETDYRNIDKAITICQSAQIDMAEFTCFDHLAGNATFTFQYDSPEFLQLCKSLPEEWQNICLKNE